MDYHSNKCDFLPCNYVIPTLKKDTSKTFAWLTSDAYSTEDFNWFDDCLFYSEVPYIPKSIYPNIHMDIHYSAFDDITPLQTYLLTIIFDTSASLSIYLHKIDSVVPINPLL